MMTKHELAENIRIYCVTHANPDNIKKYSRFFKEGYHGYGLTNQQVKDISKELVNSKKFEINLVLQAMPLLMKSGSYEETTIGLLIVNGMHKQFSDSTLNEIGSWFALGIRNWAHADILGMWILPRLMEKQLASMKDFQSWMKSPYKFQRRCVPVTFIRLLKKADDFSRLFCFLEPLMTDSEREVHQGMGWFLREAWKVKSEVTEDFLLKWKDLSPRLIFQYACEKMTKEQKLGFKRKKL